MEVKITKALSSLIEDARNAGYRIDLKYGNVLIWIDRPGQLARGLFITTDHKGVVARAGDDENDYEHQYQYRTLKSMRKYLGIDQQRNPAMKFKVSPWAASAIETDILELAADPEGYGLDAEECAAFQIFVRGYDADKSTLALSTAADAESAWRTLVDLANSYDDAIEYQRFPADIKQQARNIRRALSALGSKIAKHRH